MDEDLRKDALALVLAVRRLRVGYTRFLTDALAALNLNIPQYTALSVLGEKGEVTMGVLAEGLGITMGAVTNIVDRLTAAGFAVRDRGIHDRRVVHVKLTDAGRQTLEKAVSMGAEFLAGYLAGCTTEERKAFLATYEKLAEGMMKDFGSASR